VTIASMRLTTPTASAIGLAGRFALELWMLASFVVWGFAATTNWAAALGLGLGAAVIAATAWGRYVAPKAARRLSDPARLVFEVALFSLATLALTAAGHHIAAISLAVAYVADTALLIGLGQRHN
jgi:hypothetical protein